MSLINQALRKAQHQRTPNRPASAAEHASAPQPHYNQSPSNSKTGLIIGLVAGIALLIGLVAGLTIVVLRKDPAPAVQQATLAEAPISAATPSAPQSQTLINRAAMPSATQAPEQGEPSVLNELRLAREAAETKAAADAAATQKAAAAAAAKPSQDIIQWLGLAKVSGVRISASGNKVILNSKAYSVGETVNFALGLKVLIIQEERILFIGANGKKYLKQL